MRLRRKNKLEFGFLLRATAAKRVNEMSRDVPRSYDHGLTGLAIASRVSLPLLCSPNLLASAEGQATISDPSGLALLLLPVLGTRRSAA